MPKKYILLVEKEPQNRRLLEVSLAKAGFEVDVATSANEALASIEVQAPDFIISGTDLDDSNGFDLCKAIRAQEGLRDIPFVFLTQDSDLSSKIKGLEFGADDYLVRPVYIKDLVARIELITSQRKNGQLDNPTRPRESLTGDISDISLIEIIQTMHAGKNDGTARIQNEDSRGLVWFRNGSIIDATVDNLQGEPALFRMMRWEDGQFSIEFETPERIVAIKRSVNELIQEALNQTELWNQLCQQLPALSTICQVNFEELAEQLSAMPDSHTALIRYIDGEKSILDVVRSSDLSDVAALEIFNQLFFEGLVNENLSPRPRREQIPPTLEIGDLADAVVEAMETPKPRGESQPTPSSKSGETVSAKSQVAATATLATEEVESDDDLIDDDDIQDFTVDVKVPNSSEETKSPAEHSYWNLSESVGDSDHTFFDDESAEDMGEEFPSMQGATVTDAIDEDDFFDASANYESETDEGFEFEEPQRANPGSRKAAIILVACLIPMAIYIFTRDGVKPLTFDKSDLNDRWAESALEKQPPISTNTPLDASWNVPNLPDSGLLAASPGSEDTIRNTRNRPKTVEEALPSSEQVAMERVSNETEQPKSLESGSTASPEQKRQALALLAQSEKHLDAESFEKAADSLEKSLALDPSDVKALRLSALVHIELNKMEDSIEFALKAIRLGATIEDTSQLYQLLGQAYQSLGQIKEAKTAYENFLTIAPQSKDPQTALAVPYIQQLIGNLKEE